MMIVPHVTYGVVVSCYSVIFIAMLYISLMPTVLMKDFNLECVRVYEHLIFTHVIRWL